MKSTYIQLLLFFVLTAGVLSTGVAAFGTNESGSVMANETENITSNIGIEYTVNFNSRNNVIYISASNPTSVDKSGYINIIVDGYQTRFTSFELSSGETTDTSENITNSIDAMRDDHNVRFLSGGASAEFNFTREIHPSNTTEVPTPRITNVEVTNGSPYGQATSVVEVTVENPAEQLYGTKLMVHTLETDHNRRADATAPPGGETTVQIPVEESQGEIIAGEVRLYDNNLSDADHGFDQREFIGEADGETQVWNRTYEPVQDPYGPRSGYVYDNESMAEFVEEEQTREPTPMEHAIAGAGVLVVLLVWWYRR
jgi:hypothetical protein